MSEPSNGAWPFQEIPEEEGLDISAIFGDSSAAPQGDPFAPPAAAQSVPSSPTPVAQEITPAVAATSQPTTAPIAKAPVEAPAENPIAAAFEQKTAENTKKGLLEKPPVYRPGGLWRAEKRTYRAKTHRRRPPRNAEDHRQVPIGTELCRSGAGRSPEHRCQCYGGYRHPDDGLQHPDARRKYRASDGLLHADNSDADGT